MPTNLIQQHSDTTRILAFCWDTRPVATSYTELVKYFRQNYHCEFYIVTNGPLAEDIFVKNGIISWSIQEIVSSLADLPPQIEAKHIDKIIEYDRAVGWQVLPLDMSPYAPHEMELYYSWAAERMVTAYRFLFKNVRPSIVFNWNGIAAMQAALTLVAEEHGTPCYFMERGLLPETLVMDEQGVNFSSHIAGPNWLRVRPPMPLAEEIKMVEEYCARLQAEGKTIVAVGDMMNPEKVRDHLNVSAKALIILFPLQIEWDSNILKYSPVYTKMLDVIKDLQEVVAELENAVLVVKPHPEDKDRLTELQVACGSNGRLSTDLSINSLLDVADVVVTINSTVGLEALVRHKPVVALGQSIYSGKGFTYDVSSRDLLPVQLKTAIGDSKKGIFMTAEFHRFLVYLLKHCLFRFQGEDTWNSRENIAKKVISRKSDKKGNDSSKTFLTLLERDYSKSHSLYQEIQAEICKETAANAALNQRIEELLCSKSWRITAPLRWLHGTLAGFRVVKN